MQTARTTADSRYTAVAILLHWLIGLAIIFMLGLGLVMTQLPLPLMTKFQYFQLHKSIGITILLLVLLRIAWRLGHTPPPLPPMPRAEHGAAVGTHWLLYALMLFMPLTGWAIVSAAKRTIPTVLYGVIPWPHLPVLSTLDDKGPAEAATKALHLYGAWILIALVLLHIAAALRHYLIVHDDVLQRMIPGLPRLGRAQPEDVPQ